MRVFSYAHLYYQTGRPLDRIGYHDRKPLFAEFTMYSFCAWAPDNWPDDYHFLNPHRDGGLFLFVDFHVAWVPPKTQYYRLNDADFHWAVNDEW